MSVRLVQCLCPLRHAILAAAYEGDAADAEIMEKLKAEVVRAVRDYIINPRCAICAAPRERWTYEDRAASFETIAEALPRLRELEHAQIATQRMLQQSRN